VYEKVDKDKIVITELPIGTWTMNYLTFLEDRIDGGGGDKKKKTQSLVKDFVNLSTEVNVHITVQFEKGILDELESTKDQYGVNGLEKLLKLTTTISTTNMNMFNYNKQLHKYRTVEEIIDAYYEVRMKTYARRKIAQVKTLENRTQELSNRARFILEVVANTIDLRKYTDDNDIMLALEGKQYDKYNDKYDYLTHMPMNNMTKSKVEHIRREKENILIELEELKRTDLTTMWIRELDQLEAEYIKYKNGREKILSDSKIEVKSSSQKRQKK
jgi:DNA topoisomerase-2